MHIKKIKKNPNDRMLDKSRRVQLVSSVKVYSSYWWVLLGSWSVLSGFWSVPAGFWSVLVLVYALLIRNSVWKTSDRAKIFTSFPMPKGRKAH